MMRDTLQQGWHGKAGAISPRVTRCSYCSIRVISGLLLSADTRDAAVGNRRVTMYLYGRHNDALDRLGNGRAFQFRG